MISVIVTPIEGVKARLQVQYALPPGQTPLYVLFLFSLSFFHFPLSFSLIPSSLYSQYLTTKQ